MINFKKLIRKIKYKLASKKDIVFNDTVPSDCLKSSQLPAYLMDNDVFLYNCGMNAKYNDFIVILRTVKQIDTGV